MSMPESTSGAGTSRETPHDASCIFCDPSRLDVILHETEHFRVVADHAPLTEGHVLIVPHAHYACYGAIPARLDDELAALRQRVASFLAHTYQRAVFFEHGVFRQTVYHAHLHAMPLGPLDFDLRTAGGVPVAGVATRDDVRAWYAARGNYFYLESPTGDAALYPPDIEVYWRVLGTLRETTSGVASWVPPALRRMRGVAQMRAVERAWRAYFA